ncbi:cupin domain-containing protein [Bacteroides sp.]|uniref:cupin domain-containing protein n=1 Tax=Bacteroides sp. TaxID=29523 RepID=UPI002627E902|nr:cupin domain-containing protein [Bacteroides sp.]MDD3040621.1 cupin domain-containing protein [Bacteroides sp.]
MFKKLTATSINDAIKSTTRQYLAGHLNLPQELDHIDDTNIEIGITDYKEYTIEAPHCHKVAYEYQYMISGETKYLNVDTGEETYYTSGDFYRIDPGTKYAQKSLGGTTILFIKTPPGNDKVVVEASDDVQEWFKKWD